MGWIAVGLCVIMSVIASVHVYWAFGGIWPAKTRVQLADTVIGHQEMPGFLPTIVVAILMFGLAGFGPLLVWGGFAFLESPIANWMAWAISAVFFLRALSTVAMPWFIEASEPFRSLDKRFYAPLCVVLGIGYACLALFAPFN